MGAREVARGTPRAVVVVMAHSYLQLTCWRSDGTRGRVRKEGEAVTEGWVDDNACVPLSERSAGPNFT
jgi:hypothetical protein